MRADEELRAFRSINHEKGECELFRNSSLSSLTSLRVKIRIHHCEERGGWQIEMSAKEKAMMERSRMRNKFKLNFKVSRHDST
jgi:hypothetical protein